MWSYKSQGIDPDSSPKLPLSVTLDILSKCLKFARVQQYVAQQEGTSRF